MNNVAKRPITTSEQRTNERQILKTRMIEMIIDEDWSGLQEMTADLQKRWPSTPGITERWGDWAAIKDHVDRYVRGVLASVDAPVPDGLEDAVVTHHHEQSGGVQLRVMDIDTGQRIVELSNVTGVSVYYRWHVRDGGGYRFERVDQEGYAL